MPKRKKEMSKEDKWLRKLKKYEDKLKTGREKRKRVIIYSSDEDEIPLEDEIMHVPIEEPVAESLSQMETNLLSTPIIPNTETLDISNIQEPVLDIDTELLQSLGDFEPDPVEWGDDLLAEVGRRFQFILLNGLKKEAKDELTKRYLLPKNVPLAKAPLLNPELTSILSDTYKNRDKTIRTKQDQLGRALTALGRAMSALILKTPNIQEVVRALNDCSQLIADSHYNETYTRRSLVIPLVDKSLIDPLKERKRDEYLFGSNLTDMVKSSRGLKNTGNLMQGTSTTSNTTLNWKGPPSRARPARNFTYQSNRGGGQRTQYVRGRRYPPPGAPAASAYSTYRRVAPPPPPQPPPPPRRQTTQAPSARRPPPAHTGR